jgi:hypothetical protein
VKLIHPPQPDPAVLAAAKAESDAASEAVAAAELAADAASARAQKAARALQDAQRPADYADAFAALVAESKQPGNTLIARPDRRWKTNEPRNDIACVYPGKVQCRAKVLYSGGSMGTSLVYRRPNGEWTMHRNHSDGEWHEVTE